jgi:hypothetical protein
MADAGYADIEADVDSILPYLPLDELNLERERRKSLRRIGEDARDRERKISLEERLANPSEPSTRRLDYVTEDASFYAQKAQPVNPAYEAAHRKPPTDIFMTRVREEKQTYPEDIEVINEWRIEQRTVRDRIRDMTPLREARRIVDRGGKKEIGNIE